MSAFRPAATTHGTDWLALVLGPVSTPRPLLFCSVCPTNRFKARHVFSTRIGELNAGGSLSRLLRLKAGAGAHVRVASLRSLSFHASLRSLAPARQRPLPSFFLLLLHASPWPTGPHLSSHSHPFRLSRTVSHACITASGHRLAAFGLGTERGAAPRTNPFGVPMITVPQGCFLPNQTNPRPTNPPPNARPQTTDKAFEPRPLPLVDKRCGGASVGEGQRASSNSGALRAPSTQGKRRECTYVLLGWGDARRPWRRGAWRDGS